MTTATAERWRLYGRVWMVVQCAEGSDAELVLSRRAKDDFTHLVRDEDVRVVQVADSHEAQLQIRLPVLHHEFDTFELAQAYAVEHGLTDAVIVRKGSHHDDELARYGRAPLEPYVVQL